jgi:3-dehydroquinate synthase
MKKIKIPLDINPYEVTVGSNILQLISSEIKKKKLFNNLFVLIDSNVDLIHGEKIRQCFSDYSAKISLLKIPSGEEYKSFETLNMIYSSLLSENFGRDTLIVAIGGGVTGDISGFAAATFMRGVQYAQVPTTLLAAVDSSVGGKTAINFGGTKNIIGAFYQPKFVLTDLSFLKTLPKEEIISGLGEILKYSFLYDKSFYSLLEKNSEKLLSLDEKSLEKIVSECIKIKSAVVVNDETEKGLRKILNLGHTFAHGYESLLHYSIKHGSAVMVGLLCAFILSRRMGLMSKANFDRFSSFIKNFNPDFDYSGLDKEELYRIMLHDKKNRQGKIKFVLPIDIGQIAIDCEADKEDVIYTLAEAEGFFG